MKTIKLDISNRDSLLTDVQNNTLSLTGNDTQQQFSLELYDGGTAWHVPANASLSVWYSGPSGAGSFTHVNGASAFSVSQNTVTITPAPEMVCANGSGLMCLLIHMSDGSQRKMWNVVYTVDGIPGSESPKSRDFFAAFSGLIREAQEFVAEQSPDATLSVKGKAADAAATGAALEKKASAGYGYGEPVPLLYFSNDTDGSLLESALNELLATMSNGEVKQIAILDSPFTSNATYYGSIYRHTAEYAVVKMHSYECEGTERIRTKQGNAWQPWCWANPPMTAGVEYRTTDRYMGNPVYTQLLSCGTIANGATVTLPTNFKVIRYAARSDGYMPYPYSDATSNYYRAVQIEYGRLTMLAGSAVAGTEDVYCQIWYLKV